MQSDQDETMAVELIRLRAHQKQSRLRYIWTYTFEQLQEFFMSYPTSNFLGTTINQLVNSPDIRLVQSEHRIYFGEIVDHRKHGVGISLYRDGRIYEGRFSHNEKQGTGYQVYPNGNVYIGTYEKNKKHGQGIFYWFNMQGPKCQYYRGGWWSGLPSGKGVHERSNGDLYHGEFKNGLKHGEGSQRFSNGDSYTGLYVNGLPDGYGEYLWADGSSYKGDFKQGLRNGFGIWKKNNLPHCQSYRGHYLLDKKSGYGLYVWSEGDYYKGHFFEDMKHGIGELFNDNISVYYGVWENGQRAPHLNHEKIYSKTLKKDLPRPVSQNNIRSIRQLSEGCVNPRTERKKTESVTPDWKQKQQREQRMQQKSTSRGRKKQLSPDERQRKIQNSISRLYPSKDHTHDSGDMSTMGRSRCGHKNCIPHYEWLRPHKR